MNIVIEIIILLLDFPIIYLLFGCFIKVQPWRERAVHITVSLALVSMIYIARMLMGEHLGFSQLSMLLNVITYILMMYFISNIFFTANTPARLLLALLLMIFSLFSEYFIHIIMKAVTGANYFTSSEAAIHYCGVFAGKFIQIATIYIVNKYIKQGRQLPKEQQIYLLQSLVPFMSSVFFILYPVFDTSAGLFDDMRYFFIVIVFTLINIVHYAVFVLYQKVSSQKQESLLKLKEYEYKEEYYQKVESYQKDIRKIKHDIKNQLITIAAYIDSPKKEEASRQVRQMLEKLSEKGGVKFTQHIGVNALLNAKYNEAKRSDIACDFDIRISDQIGFTDKALGTILGNLLDNAIEACRQMNGTRYIKLQMAYFNHSLVLRAENSVKERVASLNTTKKNILTHGFGLDNIRQVAAQYNGTINCEAGDKNFIIDIILWEVNE